MVVDDLNPRYVLYAYPFPPAVRMRQDVERWPGGCMTGFLGWINQRWNEFDRLMRWSGHDPEARSDEAMFWFDLWLLASTKAKGPGGDTQAPETC
jgi:hypothetical protein